MRCVPRLPRLLGPPSSILLTLGGSRSSAAVCETACAPLGLAGLFGLGPDIYTVPDVPIANGPDAAPADSYDPFAFLPQDEPWEHWDKICAAHDSCESVGQATCAAAATVDADGFSIPAMPCVPTNGVSAGQSIGGDSTLEQFVQMATNNHRPKIARSWLPFNAMVARPVSQKEIARVQAAKDAMDKEWNRLIEQKVWDFDSVREWSDVAAEARRTGKNVQFGYVFGLCVEKNSELAPDHPSRKYKGRVVFQGNRVNQNWENALRSHFGSRPNSWNLRIPGAVLRPRAPQSSLRARSFSRQPPGCHRRLLRRLAVLRAAVRLPPGNLLLGPPGMSSWGNRTWSCKVCACSGLAWKFHNCSRCGAHWSKTKDKSLGPGHSIKDRKERKDRKDRRSYSEAVSGTATGQEQPSPDPPKATRSAADL